MRNTPTVEEQWAFGIVEAQLGVTVDASAEQVAPGQPDARLNYPDARPDAALEITRLCSNRREESTNVLRGMRNELPIPDATWTWLVNVPSRVRMPALKTHLPAALAVFEENGVQRPYIKPSFPSYDHPSVQWYAKNGITANGYPPANGQPFAGRAIITPNGYGGSAADIDEVPTWFSSEIQSKRLQTKVAKLQRTGLAELHLFVLLEHGGAPFGVVKAVAAEMQVPTIAPTVTPITHLWIFSRQACVPAGLLWTANVGWHRVTMATQPRS